MADNVIRNPILPGFHPDPSIVRAGDDYYIANSTFEWFPGVRIHHSRDLANWRPVGYALTRESQLYMAGNPDSGGIWAPCLSWSDGKFYLIYTDVKVRAGPFKDTPNYLVTAEHIEGPWSEPVFLNAGGFDPSLFHDDDGRSWLVNMIWDFRANRHSFAGIALREYSKDQKRLVGQTVNIFAGTSLRITEGPHIYKRNGYYYLMTAEGGTGWNHAVTMARARSLSGPYEVDPDNPMLTSRETGAVLQKAGHASLVETPDGEPYLVHLCSRPVGESRRCTLGRETAVQKCRWTEDGWLRLHSGGRSPEVTVGAPALAPWPVERPPRRDDFDASRLSPEFQTLRVPFDSSWASLSERPGWLRLYGRESTVSRHAQSLVARRVVSTYCEASVRFEFEPESFQQMAGLIAFYNTTAHYYACVTRHEQLGKCIRLLSLNNSEYTEPAGEGIAVPDHVPLYCRVIFNQQILHFSFSLDNERWSGLGPDLDATILSDDYCDGFTGAFVGVCCQDLSGARLHADFDWFVYADSAPTA